MTAPTPPTASDFLANTVLTFRDPSGREWLAGALVGPLVAFDDTTVRLAVEDLIDRAMVVTRVTMIDGRPL